MTGTQDTPLLIARPGENVLYTLEFAAILGEGETILAVPAVTASQPVGAAALSLGDAAFSGTQGQVRINVPAANTDGYTYHVTMTIFTSYGNTRIDCGDLQVQQC
jgi:hypothetical protein